MTKEGETIRYIYTNQKRIIYFVTTNVSNWKPISRLNKDYKLLNKAIANCLKTFKNTNGQ